MKNILNFIRPFLRSALSKQTWHCPRLTKTFLFLALFPALVFSQLKINELMTNNVSAVMDDAYNYSMWVEVYNSSSSEENQNSYYFSDNPSNKRKWQPALKGIPTGGFSVLYFEHYDSGDNARKNHATFKLEPEGGTLYLYNSSGVEVDRVTYPRQFRNTSYGRTTDGTGEWGFFIDSTPGASNNGSTTTLNRCATPRFLTLSGFHSSNIEVTFRMPTGNDSIYYTTDSTEPTRESAFYTPGSSIPLTKTTVIRAQCFSDGKLASDIVSATFFIGERDFDLPVSSVITDPKNLTDPIIGIYVDGENGKPHDSVDDRPVNWAQNWSRPANYELFDTLKSGRLNQEVDIKIVGNWSRANAQKSLAINPKKKHGDNRLRYDDLFTAKPGLKLKSLMLRNSGNDWRATMMRDAALISLVEKRMNLDYLAYEPAVIFINGVYYGIQNMRERGNEDLIFSNYGLKEEEIILLEEWDLPWSWEYRQLYEYIGSYNMANENNYNRVLDMMDMDNFIDYMITELYYANTDWPMKNIKTWKKIDGGKWRWILYDTDLAFSTPEQNMLTYMLDFDASDINNSANKIILKGLLGNETFKDDFLERFCYHISTTFDSGRVNHIIDSLSSKIEKEMVYHKQRWKDEDDWGFLGNIANMKTFGKERPDIMMRHLSERFFDDAPFYTLSVSSDNTGATYNYNKKYLVDRSSANMKVFSTQSVAVEALPVEGHKFDYWELMDVTTVDVIPYGSSWKYFDGNSIPTGNWASPDYNDSSWDSGEAPLGYVHNNGGFYNKIATHIGYGGNNANKYPTSYYRKSFIIEDLAIENDFTASIYVDDGAAIYVNGTEVFRVNLPDGNLTFNTYALGAVETTTLFNIPATLLVKGENVIAVEVHQCNATSSDVIFDLSVSRTFNSNPETINEPLFEQVLTKNKLLRAIYTPLGDDSGEGVTVAINEVVSDNTKRDDASGELFPLVYPVWVDDYFMVANAGNSAIKLIGVNGITTEVIADSDGCVNVSGLQPGLYLVVVGDKTLKIVKK